MNDSRYVQLFCWDTPFTEKEIADFLEAKKPSIIEWIAPYEVHMIGQTAYQPLVNYKKKYPDVEVRVLTNNGSGNFVSSDDGFIYESYPLMFVADTISNYNIDEVKNFEPVNRFEYKLISMFNHGHPFRCYLIDYFEKYNLLDDKNCLISWRDNNVSDYKFRWFKPRKIIIDDPLNSTGYIDAYKLAPQYHRCFTDIVAESSDNALFITEKTVKPILWMKPFLIFGCQNYNKFLSEVLGFKLFEEFIDYSFDSVKDLETRVILFVEQVRKISQLGFEDCVSLHEKLLDKLEYNRQHAFDLMNDVSFDPKIVTHWKKYFGQYPGGISHLTLPGSHRQNHWYYIMNKFGIGNR